MGRGQARAATWSLALYSYSVKCAVVRTSWLLRTFVILCPQKSFKTSLEIIFFFPNFFVLGSKFACKLDHVMVSIINVALGVL